MKKKKFIPRPKESAKVIKKRWHKKREKVELLAEKIRSLRWNISRDLKSDDEKTYLTALVIAMMDKTSERIGNDGSAANGHFGVTGFKKKHITVIGNKVHLKYTGKSGVDHEKSFSDEKIAKALKRAIKNSPSKNVFVTSDGFQIKQDKVNRYLEDFLISAKDIRGFSCNNQVVKKLKEITPEEKETQRKKQYLNIIRSVAKKIGHGSGTLRKHYLLPEIEPNFIEKGKVIEIDDVTKYNSGGAIVDEEKLIVKEKKKIGRPSTNKKPVNTEKKVEKKHNPKPDDKPKENKVEKSKKEPDKKELNALYKEHHQAWDKIQKIEDNVCEEVCEKYTKELLDVWESELKPHFKDEEENLFPYLNEIGKKKEVDELIDEHKEFDSLIRIISKNKNNTSKIKYFCEKLKKHIKREEKIMGEFHEDPYKKEEKKLGGIINKENKEDILYTFVSEKLKYSDWEKVNTPQKINDILKEFRIPIKAKDVLGKGQGGRAFLTQKNTVLKVTEDSDEAFANYLINKYQNKLKAQVKVYNVFRITDGSNNLYFIEKELVDEVAKDMSLNNYDWYGKFIEESGSDYADSGRFKNKTDAQLLSMAKKRYDNELEDYGDVEWMGIRDKRNYQKLKEHKNEIIELIYDIYLFRRNLSHDDKIKDLNFDDLHSGNFGFKNGKFLCFDCTMGGVKSFSKGGDVEIKPKKHLFHSVTSDSARDFVLENGIKPDSQNFVYLSEKPITRPPFKHTFKVTVPDENKLWDWKDIWNEDENKQYDKENPYFIYEGGIGKDNVELVFSGGGETQKHSNLTLEQQKLVRTPEFKNWFGDWEIIAKAKSLSHNVKGIYAHVFNDDTEQALFEISVQAHGDARSGITKSVGEEIVELALQLYPNAKLGDKYVPVVSKVVDENGEPLVVYHSTYDKEWGDENEVWFKESFVFDPHKEGKETYEKRRDRKYGGIYFSRSKEVAEQFGRFTFEFFLNFKDPIVLDAKGENIRVFNHEIYSSGDRDVIVKRTEDQMLPSYTIITDIFITSNPNSIKLADGRNVKFDVNNPDVRMENGGQAHSISDSDKKYIDSLLEYVYYNNPDEEDEFMPNEAPDWIIKGSQEYLKKKGIDKIYRGIQKGSYEGDDAFSWTYDRKIAQFYAKENGKILENPLPKDVISVEFVFDWVKKQKNYKYSSRGVAEYVDNFYGGENEVILTNSEMKKGGAVNPFAVCTSSIGKTEGTTKRSTWDKDAIKRYEKCVLAVKEKKSEGGELTVKRKKVYEGDKLLRDMTYEEAEKYMSLYHEKKGNFMIPKGFFVAWMYDETNFPEKINSGEYDFLMFPPPIKYQSFRLGYGVVESIWRANFQKLKGAKHLLGMVQGWYDEENKKVVIQYMSVRPSAKRNRINTFLVKGVKKHFETDEVEFDEPTKEGTIFMEGKTYGNGGSVKNFVRILNKDGEQVGVMRYETNDPERNVTIADMAALAIEAGYKVEPISESEFENLKHSINNKLLQKFQHDVDVIMGRDIKIDDPEMKRGGDVESSEPNEDDYNDYYYGGDEDDLSGTMVHYLEENADKFEKSFPDSERFILSHEEKITFRKQTEFKEELGMKPKGLWYGLGMSWVYGASRFARHLAYTYEYIHKLTINESRVCILDTPEKYVEFTKKYGEKASPRIDWMFINWNKVSKDYSGIETHNPRGVIGDLGNEIQVDGKNISTMSYFNWLLSWDVSGGCIWAEDAIKNIDLVFDWKLHKVANMKNGGGLFDENYAIAYRSIRGDWKPEYKGWQYYSSDKDYSQVWGRNTKKFKIDLSNALSLEKWNKLMREAEPSDTWKHFQIGDLNIKQEYQMQVELLANRLGVQKYNEFMIEFKNCDVIYGKEAGSNTTTYAVRNQKAVEFIGDEMANGGSISDEEKSELYSDWRELINMSASELEKFYNSEEGKEAGLSKKEADDLGIHSGRESAKWIMKMKKTPNKDWTPKMWEWAKRQVSFVKRMKGNKGDLIDDKGNKTRKHLALLIWGHNPKK